MDITKRNGSMAPFDREKIATAIKKSFISTSRPIVEEEIRDVAIAVEQVIINHPAKLNVECIQDEVERSLMQRGFYAEAKSYILFRWQRTEQRKYLNRIANTLQQAEIAPVLKGIAADFEPELYPIAALAEKFMGFVKADMNGRDKLSALIKAAVELTSAEAPNWEFIAARLLSYRLQRDLETFEQAEDIQSFAQKVRHLASQNLYGAYIVDAYTESELQQAASFIDEERNKLLNYSGLDLLIKRYVIRSFAHKPVESVQEMFLGIALHLAMNEGENRLHWVKKFYDMLSRLEVTMATPTLANARKPFHQLSSCFIDTVPDSLEGIYRSIDNFAQVSKFGGGMGLYFGKVRAAGGRIRGFKGAAGGVVRWMKLVNDTAVAVDQLGVRQGAVAVYLDVWHKDLPEFLQLRTNNGDDRMKAHDIFPAVCYPDLFWKMAQQDLNQDWHMFCPNEVLTTRGYSLEDFYGEAWEEKYHECVADKRLSRRTMTIKDVIRLLKQERPSLSTAISLIEPTPTGTMASSIVLISAQRLPKT